jgi:hypothetical protein
MKPRKLTKRERAANQSARSRAANEGIGAECSGCPDCEPTRRSCPESSLVAFGAALLAEDEQA